MATKKKSVRSRISGMKVGACLRISLKDIKYQSLQSTLYQMRREGMQLTSSLNADKSSVIITRQP